MLHRGLWGALALVGLCMGSVAAQSPGSAVQLPTFSHFGVGTTVSVPDRGSAYMGGINRSASGRNSFGSPLLPFRPFRNSAIGSEQSAMGVHVSAWIHDFEAMDEYLLRQPVQTVRPGMANRNAAAVRHSPVSLDPAWNAAHHRAPGKTTDAQWGPGPDTVATPLLNVEQEQQRREAQAESRSSEAQAFFLRGQEAEASGKANVARIYYQMAARRASGQLQTEVLARLRAIAHEEASGNFARVGE